MAKRVISPFVGARPDFDEDYDLRSVTARMNAYRQGLAGMRRGFNESAFILITNHAI